MTIDAAEIAYRCITLSGKVISWRLANFGLLCLHSTTDYCELQSHLHTVTATPLQTKPPELINDYIHMLMEVHEALCTPIWLTRIVVVDFIIKLLILGCYY